MAKLWSLSWSIPCPLASEAALGSFRDVELIILHERWLQESCQPLVLPSAGSADRWGWENRSGVCWGRQTRSLDTREGHPELHPPAGTQHIPLFVLLGLGVLSVTCPVWCGFPWCEDEEMDLGRKGNTVFGPGKSLAHPVRTKEGSCVLWLGLIKEKKIPGL